MKVYIDGQEFTDFLGDGRAVSILDAVKRSTTNDGLVVTEIRLDDVVMDEEAFSRVSGGLAAHFTTRSVRGLVLESLEEALKYIPRLSKGFEEIALHFEKNEFAAGEGKLADGADGLDWLLRVFQNCSSLLTVGDADSDGLREQKDSLADSISSLAAFHSEKNYPRMAYFIRQNLAPEIEKFSMYVQKLRDLASSTQ